MKPFDYQKYIKNNPLLKESINEATLKDLIKPLVAKLESMGYEVDSDPTPGFQTLEAFKTYPDGSILRMYLTPSDKEVDQRRDMPDDNRGLSDYSTLDVSFTYWPIKVTKKFFGLYKSKKRVMQDLPDEAGTNIDLGTGMFDIPVEDSVNRVISLLKKAEQKVAGGTPTRQLTGDADADFMGEGYDDEEGSGFSYEYQEGPGASPQEIARTIKQFKSDMFTWNKRAKNDFYSMAQGQSADIKSDYYPEWKRSDFEQVIAALEGGSTSMNEALGQENNYKKAALELVTLAKNLISRAGESLVMNSEVKKASMITDEDGLSKLYYHLQDVLGELIGSEARAFTREAKKIIVNKYGITMTDEYGSPMKWR